jgi:hypothetical protein
MKYKNFPIALGVLLFVMLQAPAQSLRVSELVPGDLNGSLKLAMHSGADTLIIDNGIKTWNLKPMRFNGIKNKVILIDAGVRIQAEAGAFLNVNDALLTFTDSDNISLLGQGNVLAMNKEEYTRGEWRHVISLRGCRNFIITDLTLRDSGGDGIYIAGSRMRPGSQDIFIEKINSLNNKRQGISIISAKGVYIHNSEFSHTKGTLPGAGVDIEPNRPEDLISNIFFENCIFRNNYNAGIKIELWKLTSASEAVSITFSDCLLQNNHDPDNPRVPAEISIGAHRTDPVKGKVVFERCLIENSSWGVLYSRKAADAFHVLFQDCSAINICRNNTMPAILLEVADYRKTSPDLGGFEFRNTYFKYSSASPVLVVRGSRLGTLHHVRDITGDITYSSILKETVKYINYDPQKNIDFKLEITKR